MMITTTGTHICMIIYNMHTTTTTLNVWWDCILDWLAFQRWYISFYCFDVFDSANNFYFGIDSFPIDGFGHWTVISYQFIYTVQGEVGVYTIVIYFHTTMVNNKKQSFWLFLLVICFFTFYVVRWASFELQLKKNWLACAQTGQKIVCWLSVYVAILLSTKPVFYFEKLASFNSPFEQQYYLV